MMLRFTRFVFSLLILLAFAPGVSAQVEVRRGFVDSTDCGLLTNPVIGAIICLQTTDTPDTGRTKGTLYTWNGTAWAEYFPPSGVGLSTLNGLAGGTQTFANDTNVTLSSAGTTHTLGWTGQLSVARGGTSASNASGARTALGLAIGSDVQGFNDNLAALAAAVGTGLWKITGVGTGETADFADIVELFGSGSCSGFLKSDGTCDAGTVSELDPIVGAVNGIVKGNGAGNIALAIAGTDYLAPDVELTSIAGLTSAADRLPYYTGSGTAALATFTAFARTLVDDATAGDARTTLGLGTIATQAASSVTITGGSITGITDLAVADGGTGASTAADARTNLGLVIGTNVQAFDAELAALAGLTSAADSLPYFTGAGTASLTTLTTYARSLLDDANASTARSTLGLVIGTDVQAQDSELTAIAGLSSAADRLPYYTGSGTAALATFTAFARTLVDDASASDARTTLGLVIGTNVQAFDAELSAIAGLTSAADKIPYFTGSGTAAVADFTAYGRLLVAVADEAAFQALINMDAANVIFTPAGDIAAIDVQAAIAEVDSEKASRAGANTFEGQNSFDLTIGTISAAGAPGATDCTINGIHGVSTTTPNLFICTGGAGSAPIGVDTLGDAYNQFSDGSNSSNAVSSDVFRFGAMLGLNARVWEQTTAFTNQPANDAIEILSSEAADITQTATIWGTINGTQNIVKEIIALDGADGTTPVASTRTNWGLILAVELSATTTGNITVREASGDATITTITAGNTKASTLDQLIASFTEGLVTVVCGDAEASDTYVCAGAPPLTALPDRAIILFEPATTNTGAATLNIDGLGAVDVTNHDGTALADGTLVAGRRYLLAYDSDDTAFKILGGGGGGVSAHGDLTERDSDSDGHPDIYTLYESDVDATVSAAGACERSGQMQFATDTRKIYPCFDSDNPAEIGDMIDNWVQLCGDSGCITADAPDDAVTFSGGVGLTTTCADHTCTTNIDNHVKSQVLQLSSDGTQCGDPAYRTINSGWRGPTIICADNDGSTIFGLGQVPDGWAGGTFTFELQYVQTAADTSALNSDISAACRAPGDTMNNTWGTEIAIDDAAVTGSNGLDHTTSAAVTPDGTCAAGDTLFVRWQMDATGTTTAVATLHFLAIKAEYTVTGAGSD